MMNTPILIAGLSFATLTGCISTSHPLQTRPITAQLVTTHAIERAVAQLDLGPLGEGDRVSIDASSLAADEQVYLEHALRTRIREMGAVPVTDAADADWIVRMHARGLGGTTRQFIFGVPALPIPTMDLTTPEIPILSFTFHRGFAQLHALAVRADRTVVIPPVQDQARREIYQFLFLSFESEDVYLER